MTKAMPLKLYPHTANSLGCILGSPEEQAQLLANSLVIPFFVQKDGTISQNGPGREFKPKEGSGILPLGSPTPTSEQGE